jgi:hypothetical protein
MNWFSVSSGQAARPGRRPAFTPAAHRERTEVIRAAMLETMEGLATPEARGLMRRILCAGDAERLWYLRPEAMSILASSRGEALARQTLAQLSVHFKDVLPGGLASELRAAGPVWNRPPDTSEETS